MDAQRAAEIQVVLEGVPLPATRKELAEYAAYEDGDVASLLIDALPDEEFDRIDAVGEALMRAPRPAEAPQRLPAPESGKPPGGSDYLNPSPESGAVRPSAPRTNPPQKALEEQTKVQKKQQKKQSG